MDVYDGLLILLAALLAWTLLVEIRAIVRILRTGRATHYVVTLKSGVSQPYDYAEQITRGEQPALFWKIVGQRAFSLFCFTAFLGLTLSRDHAKSWLERVF